LSEEVIGPSTRARTKLILLRDREREPVKKVKKVRIKTQIPNSKGAISVVADMPSVT
jgi:hypothetical protein